MALPRKRNILELLTKTRLVGIARAFELGIPTSEAKESFVEAIGRSKAASFRKILWECSLDDLRSFCDHHELARSGSKSEVIARLLGDNEESVGHDHLPLFSGDPEKPKQPRAKERQVPPRGAGTPHSADASPTQATASPTASPARRDSDGPPLPQPVVADESVESLLGSLVVKVHPRKPRLAWHGMARREVAGFVPTQVVEVVHPARAMGTTNELSGIDSRTVSTREPARLPPNRLIWTNDNLVALQTLLDERDPASRDYRYRGKIDVVYIDPPFMVNNDFRGDNSIDIDIDEKAGVRAKKEPSLVEILAYKDTWREGLDSFLSMLKGRLVLLKDLLAASGTIYVHLDYHAAHYVKVLMDEIFGYENFRNEIVWQRSVPKSLMSRRLPNNHDVLLCYGNGGESHWNEAAVFQEYDEENLDEKTAEKYSLRDSDGRYVSTKMRRSCWKFSEGRVRSRLDSQVG